MVQNTGGCGIDPCENKRVKNVLPDANQTFEAIARQWHASNKKWSESHSERVIKSLESHAFSFIGLRDIASLTTPDLLVPVRAADKQN